jgi:hypothetical protein
VRCERGVLEAAEQQQQARLQEARLASAGAACELLLRSARSVRSCRLFTRRDV